VLTLIVTPAALMAIEGMAERRRRWGATWRAWRAWRGKGPKPSDVPAE
jgi:hypothetical protein